MSKYERQVFLEELPFAVYIPDKGLFCIAVKSFPMRYLLNEKKHLLK